MITEELFKVYEILFIFNFLKDFIYSWEREAETEAEGEAGSMQGPDVGLRTPGLCPEPEADAQPLIHPGGPLYCF